MISAQLFMDLKEVVESSFATMKEYLDGLKGRDKEYLEFKGLNDNSFHFRIGLRNFVILAEIHPLHKKPHFIFKTFEIIDFIQEKKIVEFQDLELTHFNDDNNGSPIRKYQLQESYFSKLEKAIYLV